MMLQDIMCFKCSKFDKCDIITKQEFVKVCLAYKQDKFLNLKQDDDLVLCSLCVKKESKCSDNSLFKCKNFEENEIIQTFPGEVEATLKVIKLIYSVIENKSMQYVKEYYSDPDPHEFDQLHISWFHDIDEDIIIHLTDGITKEIISEIQVIVK